jgi:hypothetical protein
MSAQIKLVLDTFRQNRIAPVFSMVGDYGEREIRAIITCDGDPHAVPVTAEVTINAKRPDGQKKRFSGAANGDGSVTVPITQWMLELRGGVECTISAVGIGTKLTTTPITLTVLQTPTGEDISPDDPEYDLLAQVLAGEAERVEAEKTRVVNEQTRVDAEAVRAENEAQREANEDVRRTNEAARVNAEQNRADTFAGWVGDMGQLGNFNARLTNVESVIYGDLAREVVDDSMAYTKPVPAAAKPNARVDMIGGMTRKCTNLIPYPYAETTLTRGGVTFTDKGDGGITLSGTATDTVAFILCELSSKLPTGYYSVIANNVCETRCFLADGTSATYDSNGNNINVTSPIVRIALLVREGRTYNGTIYPMLNEGSTALPYEPYFEGLRSAKVESVESVGGQLFDIDNYNVYAGYITGGYIKEFDKCKIVYMRCQPNTTYTVSKCLTARFDVGFTNEIPSAEVSVLNSASDMTGTKATLTANSPDNAKYIVIWFYHEDHDTLTPEEILATLMVNKGSTALPYTPYVKHTLPIPAEVREKPWYGLGISKDVCNAIRYNADGSRVGDVKCGEVDLGTLDWSIQVNSTGNNFFQSSQTVPRAEGDGEGTMLCSPYTTRNNRNALDFDKTIAPRNASANVSVCVRDDSYTDAAAFKAAMSGVMLVYELATPTTEGISDILPADNYIGVEGGGTLAFVNEYGYDVPSEVVFVTKEVTE